MIKFETINGTLCRMVEPTPLQLDSPMPCVVRYIQGSSPMGRYLKRKYAMVIKTVAKVSRIGADGRAYSSDKSFVEEVEVLEIIGYPVVDGSAEWALWQMKQGHEIINSNGTIPFCHHEGRILRCGDDISWDIDYWLRIYDDMRGWQLYEEKPEPEPPREPGASTQSVPNPVVSNKEEFLSLDETGWQLYKEPKPETAKGQFKVKDWVEFNPGNNPKQVEIVEIDGDGDKLYYNTRYAGKTIKMHIYASAITRKLDPSEIVLDFGNGIRGTIRRYRGEQIRIYDGDINFACLAISYVTEPMQTTVRKLLAAIEEERKKQ